MKSYNSFPKDSGYNQDWEVEYDYSNKKSKGEKRSFKNKYSKKKKNTSVNGKRSRGGSKNYDVSDWDED